MKNEITMHKAKEVKQEARKLSFEELRLVSGGIETSVASVGVGVH